MSCPYFYSCMLHKLLSHLVVFFIYFIINIHDSHASYEKKKFIQLRLQQQKHRKVSSQKGFVRFRFLQPKLCWSLHAPITNTSSHCSGLYCFESAPTHTTCCHNKVPMSQSESSATFGAVASVSAPPSWTATGLDGAATVTWRNKCIKATRTNYCKLVLWIKVLKWLCIYFIKVFFNIISPEIFLMNNKCIHPSETEVLSTICPFESKCRSSLCSILFLKSCATLTTAQCSLQLPRRAVLSNEESSTISC